MTNPYKPPSTDKPAGSMAVPKGAACPSCQTSDYEVVKFSWWGGVLGPKLFNHVACNHCGTTFNSKTGRSNNTAITVYLIVATLIGIGATIAFLSLR